MGAQRTSGHIVPRGGSAQRPRPQLHDSSSSNSRVARRQTIRTPEQSIRLRDSPSVRQPWAERSSSLARAYQDGSMSSPGSVVSRVTPVPSTFIT